MPKKNMVAVRKDRWGERPREPAKTSLPQKTANPASIGEIGGQDFRHPHFLASSHFTLREDGSIQFTAETQRHRDMEENQRQN